MCVYVCVCCAFVGLNNKLYKIRWTYIKIVESFSALPSHSY